MAIRIRYEDGRAVAAVCAAKTMSKPGDIYLDDGVHYVLTTKFATDFNDEDLPIPLPIDPIIGARMEAEENEPSENLSWWKSVYAAPSDTKGGADA